MISFNQKKKVAHKKGVIWGRATVYLMIKAPFWGWNLARKDHPESNFHENNLLPKASPSISFLHWRHVVSSISIDTVWRFTPKGEMCDSSLFYLSRYQKWIEFKARRPESISRRGNCDF
jgi:hypothetical protein